MFGSCESQEADSEDELRGSGRQHEHADAHEEHGPVGAAPPTCGARRPTR